MMAQSLQQRIRRGQLLTLLLVFPMLWLFSDSAIQNLTRQFVLSRLEHDAESLIGALSRSDNGTWSVNPGRLPSFYNRPQSGHYFQVSAGEQTLRSRSLWDYAVNIPQLVPGEKNHSVTQADGERWLAYVSGIHKQGQDLTIWVAEDISPIEKARWRFELYLALLLVVALVVLLTMQHILLSRGFRPLQGIRNQIRALRTEGPESLDASVPLEMKPLVLELDRLLKQLDQRTRRSRNALGNLAHELKRPLQQLAVMQSQLGETERVQLETIQRQMQHLIDRELKRARIAGSPTPGRLLDPAGDLYPLIQIMERLHPKCRITCLDDTRQPWPVDRDDGLELLGNLLDNACKFASGKCRIWLKQIGSDFCVQVEDDGPGVSPEERHEMTRRGIRLDESKSGHGLGLSICRDIVDSYGGSLLFEASELGGLSVQVTFPQMTQDPEFDRQD